MKDESSKKEKDLFPGRICLCDGSQLASWTKYEYCRIDFIIGEQGQQRPLHSASIKVSLQIFRKIFPIKTLYRRLGRCLSSVLLVQVRSVSSPSAHDRCHQRLTLMQWAMCTKRGILGMAQRRTRRTTYDPHVVFIQFFTCG
jgi:hypothetical protein